MTWRAVLRCAVVRNADSKELQAALSRRAAAVAEGDSSSCRPLTVSSGTDHNRLAYLLSDRLNEQGWAELATIGRQDLALPIAMQVSVFLPVWLPALSKGTLHGTSIHPDLYQLARP